MESKNNDTEASDRKSSREPERESGESSAKCDEISISLETLDSDQEEPVSGESQTRNSTRESILVLADRVLGKIDRFIGGQTQGQEEFSPNPTSKESRIDSDHDNDEMNTSNEDILEQLPDESFENKNNNDERGNVDDGKDESDEGVPKRTAVVPIEDNEEELLIDRNGNDEEDYIIETIEPFNVNDGDHLHEMSDTDKKDAFDKDVTEPLPLEPFENNEEIQFVPDENDTETTPAEPFENNDNEKQSHDRSDSDKDMNEDVTETTPMRPTRKNDGDKSRHDNVAVEEDADITDTIPADPLENHEEDQSRKVSVNDENDTSLEDITKPTPVDPKGNNEVDLSHDGSISDEDISEGNVIKPMPADSYENNDDDHSSEVSASNGKEASGEDITDDVTETPPVEPSGNNEDNPTHDGSANDEEGKSNEQPSENNEEDFSHMGIASNVSDMEEIDLNSDSDGEDEDGALPSRPGSHPTDIETGLGGFTQGRSNRATGGSSNISHGATFLGTYFDVLYDMGLSLRRGDGTSPRGNWNYIPFLLVAFIAIFQMLILLKGTVLNANDDEDILLYYIELGYAANTFIFRILFMYILLLQFDAVQDSVKALRVVAITSNKKVRLIVGLLVLVSTVASISYSILIIVSRFTEGNSNLLLISSYDLAEALFLWNKQDVNNETDIIFELYGSNITPATVAMGLFKILMDIIAYTHESLIKDAGLLDAYDMYLICSDFVAQLDNIDAQTMTPEVAAILWTRYKQIRSASKKVNSCMRIIIPVLYMENISFITYFFYDHMYARQSFVLTGPETYVLAKIFCFYGLALMASLINTKFHDWIQSSFRGQNTPFIENGEHVQTMNLLHELEKDPIGIGEGMFFIGGPFVSKFVTIVGSFFFFLRETNNP